MDQSKLSSWYVRSAPLHGQVQHSLLSTNRQGSSIFLEPGVSSARPCMSVRALVTCQVILAGKTSRGSLVASHSECLGPSVGLSLPNNPLGNPRFLITPHCHFSSTLSGRVPPCPPKDPRSFPQHSPKNQIPLSTSPPDRRPCGPVPDSSCRRTGRNHSPVSCAPSTRGPPLARPRR